MKKKCWIRSDKNQGCGSCPFGLPISLACKNAGSSVTHMYPLENSSEEEREKVEKANKKIYIYNKTNEKCIYAANIMEGNIVNCDYGDTGAGMGAPTFSGSPIYPQTFNNGGLGGMYATPFSVYTDYDSSRNLFMGLFSLMGRKILRLLKKS